MRYFTIRRARPSDLDEIFQLRGEAERWLAGRGIEQWTSAWHDRAYRLIRESVLRGETWVVTSLGEVVATVALSDPDRDFWHESDDLDAAAYLYKLIVRRDHAGVGLGDAILDWACGKALADGRRWLRIDVWRDNHGLQNYYRHRGFRHVRTEVVPGRLSGALFQRRATARLGPPDVRLLEDPEDEEWSLALTGSAHDAKFRAGLPSGNTTPPPHGVT